MDGILNIYKEKGFTSHDVVAKLRGILHQKKIGHTGTLDPDAEGVLPICLGRATKVCGLLTDKDKVYEAEMLLGTVTDTQDITGRILGEKSAAGITEEMIRSVLESFVGSYDQVPPMYSAVKIQGKKLYELARSGMEVERPPRQVEIYDISKLRFFAECDQYIAAFTVHCSKGTYIRTLCHDVGERLGCGACMRSLKRIKTGRFDISEAYTLSYIKEFVHSGNIQDILINIDELFLDIPRVQLFDEERAKLLSDGNPFIIHAQEVSAGVQGFPERLRIYNRDGKFAAIYQWRSEKRLYFPEKMF